MTASRLGECQHCERDGVPAYDYTGRIVDPELAANVELAREDDAIFAACADCIHGGNVRKRPYELERMRPIANRFAPDANAALDSYHLIPHIPLMMQSEDWPMCCNDWCEFTGNPPDLNVSVRVPVENEFWDRGPSEFDSGFELQPESLREICLFRCLTCSKTYFIWQPT